MKNNFQTITSILSMTLLLGGGIPAFADANNSCGNNSQEGSAPSCKQPKCQGDNGDSSSDDGGDDSGCTSDSVALYTGNERRIVDDLKVWGGVGQHQLAWTRFGDSRYINGVMWLGNGHNWRHSYQWEMTASSDSNGPLTVNLFYPNGVNCTFTRTTTPGSVFKSTPAITDELFLNGAQDTFTMQRANGWQYVFKLVSLSARTKGWQLSYFLDSQQNQYTLTYDGSNRLSQITEPGGRSLSITYQVLSFNAVADTTLITLGTPVNGSNTVTVPAPKNTTPYRYLRYQGHDQAYSPVAEIQFSGTGGVLSGTAFGSGEAQILGEDYTKAFDGDTGTFFQSTIPSGDYVGLDLGTAKTVSSITFFPPAGNAAAMKNGYFIASNQKPASITVISRVDTSDGRSVTYTYTPFTDPALPDSWQVLSAANYGDGTSAAYTYAEPYPVTQPLLTHAVDPRVRGQGTNLMWVYDNQNSNIVGYVKQELNGVTGQAIINFTADTNITPVANFSNGGRTAYRYSDVTSRLQYKTDSLGRTTNYTYDQVTAGKGYGFVASKTDALGRVTSYTNSSFGNLLGQTNPDSSTESWTRDSLDLVLTHTDELGRTTAITRDASHRVTRVDYPDSSYETFAYNAFSEVTSHRLRNGGTETNVFDGRGLKTSHTDPLGNVTTFTYDANDCVATATDARANTTSYTYNERGLVIGMTYADGNSTSCGYDSFGNQTSVTNELGNIWTKSFDEFRRVRSKADPLSRTTSYSYDLPGGGCGCSHSVAKPTKITLPSGKITAIAYDTEWRKTSETVGFGTADAATTNFGYDVVNNPTSVTDPRGKVWTKTFNNRGWPASETDPLGHTASYTYDSVGNNLTTTRPDAGVTTNVYDAMNRMTQSTDPKGEVTAFAYDNADNLVTLTDARSNAYSFTYDLLNRKLSMGYPDSSRENFAYDAVGNLATYTTRAGQVKTSTYDTRNRETAFSWSDSTPAVAETYDAAGRLLTLNNANSNLTYTYDTANQLLSETQAIVGALSTKTVSYTYDAGGNRATLTYPAGDVVSYAYTGRNQTASISLDGPPPLASYTYDLNGNVLGKTLENNTVATSTYDNANRLTNLAHTVTGSSAAFASFGYAYNNVNDRTHRVETSGTNTPVTDNYTYDAIDQVAGASYGSGRNVNYAYDSTGNRTSVVDSGTTTSYTTNNLNQYTGVGSLPALTYDGNGNLIGYNSWTYAYDAQNRLVSATSGTSSAAFAYDARNRCVSRAINGATMYYTFDGWNLIEDRNSGDIQQAYYIHGQAVDELLAMIMTGSNYFYHADAIGNIMQITNAIGQVVENCVYDVYGTATIKDGAGHPLTTSSIGNRFLFTGREYVQWLGLCDYRNRFYSQDLGRFMQVDPIRFSGGDFNIYRYVNNDITDLVDPEGLKVYSTAELSPDQTQGFDFGFWGGKLDYDVGHKIDKWTSGPKKDWDENGKGSAAHVIWTHPCNSNDKVLGIKITEKPKGSNAGGYINGVNGEAAISTWWTLRHSSQDALSGFKAIFKCECRRQ